LIDQQEEQKQNPQPETTPQATPKTEPVKPNAEDLQLKKALELMQDKAQAAKAGGE
jgi:hypothetical protein